TASTVRTKKTVFYTMSLRKTARTGYRSISRMHMDNLYPLSLCFICNKLPKLVERPAVQTGAHPFVGPDPQADIFQILENNSCTTIPFSFQDNLFGNTMIHIGGVTSFLARDLPQSLLCRLR